MKKTLLFTMALLPFVVQAQKQLTGVIVDQSGKPLQNVNVTLSLQSGTTVSSLSDSGRFSLSYHLSGIYKLSASLVGYQSIIRELILPKDTVKIIMPEVSAQLGTVGISATRPIIERKIDRVIYNVENSIVATGGSAWEALEKAPGITIDANNSISANKKSTRIYVDGKPLNLSGDDLASYLHGLPSDVVSKIEVFSNPPASFDAEGGAAINIITKKSRAEGFNLAVTSAYTKAAYGSSLQSSTFNYRRNKLNLYGSYGYGEKKYKSQMHQYVNYHTATGNSLWDSPAVNIIDDQNQNYRLAADYQLSKNQVVGVLLTGANTKGNTMSNTPTAITSNNRTTLDSSLLTSRQAYRNINRYSYNLNYNIKLDTSGKMLNLDVDYSPFRSSPRQYVHTVSFLPDGKPASSAYQIYTPTIQNIDIYSGKLDYNYKIGHSWTLVSGVKYSSIKSSNNFDFYTTAGSSPQLIAANSNQFHYTENTAAAYTSIAGSFGKWTFEGGLRAEQTHTRGFSITLDSLNKRQYFKLFPSIVSLYRLDENHTLQFNYSYRINRPGYSLLNPARQYTNPYNYYEGNPILQPSFMQSVELGYTYKKDYTITVYYTSIHDLFTNVTEQDNNKQLFSNSFRNLGLGRTIGTTLTASFHPTAWWDMNIVLDGYFDREASAYLQSSYDLHLFAYDGNTTQSFLINKKIGLKAEISAVYNSPVIFGFVTGGKNSQVDAGVKATILNGQGTIKLAAGDIFYGNIRSIKVDALNQNNGFRQTNGTRNGTLSLSYRIGNNVALARKRTTAAEEENKRTQ